ncbi:TetR/AcrR family transcriptional regulator [Pyxidicoccus fallax]|uniref:TetR/AcrR family transcriptional regulator n=1 Tax=Pyxidicoccus fallax TaxID=394095 RepID=A0A848LJH4_9BACT|nr:TetR/AcrR family transcriptional regulator [Pyxidicoccus fallax]NMO17873.1 TetR/AcrR family transcriptional regulator [Pyxidicoccus fallax]NPC81161.1 TetR/AcrR family transcriptional regulator [Pyxidicoccus fallax]
MPQVLKDEVRERILAAALQEFAAHGFAGATMTAIAGRAGLGTASTYRYYAGKGELFDAVVTPELAQRFESLLERRVRALARATLDEAPRSTGDLGDELLRFWVQNRLAVVILLDRAEGTAYARFGERFVELLVAGTLAQLREQSPGLRVSAAARFVLTRIFENTRRTLAAILEAHEKEEALREAIEAFWSYQLPGLHGFAAWLRREPA